MYLECNTNVPDVSRILAEYFPIGYKMLPNFAFSLVDRCSVDPLDDVALLQIADLYKQDLLIYRRNLINDSRCLDARCDVIY